MTLSALTVSEANSRLRSTALDVAADADVMLRRLGDDADAIVVALLTKASRELRAAVANSNKALDVEAFGPGRK